MNKNKKLAAVQLLEERIKGASPQEAGKIAKRLVKLKDNWLNH